MSLHVGFIDILQLTIFKESIMLERYEQFSFMVSVINRQIQKIERDEMIKCGYKGAFAQYLIAMRHYPEGVTSAQLSEICDKDKAAVSRVTTEMIKSDLVGRRSANETLYRARLSLTQKGRSVADYLAKRASAAVEAVGSELSDEERKSFYRTLNFIATKLQLMSQEGIPQ